MYFCIPENTIIALNTSFLLQNNLCELTTHAHKFERLYGVKTVLTASFKDFGCTKINRTQIW